MTAFLAVLYVAIGAGMGLYLWLTDRANLDVVQDRCRALRRALLAVLLVAAWPGALVIDVLCHTPHGHAAVRWFVFGERPEKSTRT